MRRRRETNENQKNLEGWGKSKIIHCVKKKRARFAFMVYLIDFFKITEYFIFAVIKGS